MHGFASSGTDGAQAAVRFGPNLYLQLVASRSIFHFGPETCLVAIESSDPAIDTMLQANPDEMGLGQGLYLFVVQEKWVVHGKLNQAGLKRLVRSYGYRG
jgi:hypothetical protein